MMSNAVTTEDILRISGVDPRKCMFCGKCSGTCPAYDEMDYHPHEFVYMVRWGMTEAFTTPLSALSSIGYKDSEATSFKFKVKAAFPSRSWWTNWDTKWYLSPIPTVEINKDYGMTQNPGW